MHKKQKTEHLNKGIKTTKCNVFPSKTDVTELFIVIINSKQCEP